MGLLPDIAEGLSESLSFTGLIITGYAWVVAITSLPLALATAALERRKLLLALMGIFALAHLVMPWVTTFGALLIARIAVALSHAVFWSIMMPLAARMAPKGQRAKGIAAVMAGCVLATVFGVPIGTKLGHWFGWQEAFAIVGGAAVVSGLWIAMVLPEAPSRKAGSLASLPVILKRPAMRQLYLIAAVAMLGNFTVYSYVSPIVTEAAGGTLESVVTLLLVFGLSGFVGTLIVTRLLEANPSIAIVAPLTGLTTAFLFFLPTAALPWVHWPLIIIWGASLTGLMMALNNLILAAGHDAADVSTSMMSGIINVGIGGGAFLGVFVVRVVLREPPLRRSASCGRTALGLPHHLEAHGRRDSAVRARRERARAWAAHGLGERTGGEDGIRTPRRPARTPTAEHRRRFA